MNPLWPLYVAFLVFLGGTIAFSGLAVYLGYFSNPPQSVMPLAIAAVFSALVTCGIGNSIVEKFKKH